MSIGLEVPPAAPDARYLPAIEVSCRRFEQKLRDELGFMAAAVDVNKYVQLYREELHDFVVSLKSQGLAK